MFLSLDKHWQKPLPYFLTLTVLAVATPLAFAPYYYFWLMPFLFAGFVALTEIKPHRQISSAYWFGLVSYTAQFWWIHTALHDVSGLPNAYAIPLTFLLPAFLALFPAIAFWLYSKHHLPRLLAVGVLLPLLWTLTEFARERVFTGFGWGALGYSQIADYSPLAAFAPIGGIHLVTLATAALSCWVVLVLRNKSIIQRIIFAAAICVLWEKASEWRKVEYTQAQTKQPVSVALLQGNIPQALKFDEANLTATYQRYFDQLSATKAKIVVLPETAFPDFLQHTDKAIVERFAEQAKKNGNALALGIPAFTADGKGYLNAMINLTDFDPQQPEKMQVYAKNHLVPFGEFKPIPQLTEPLYQKMNMPLADFKRGGTGQEPFTMANLQVAFNICYEDGFGDELIDSAKKSSLLANASNMAWYGKSNAMWQQLQQSQARALELGRYMIRATNTGASAIISPRGQVLKFSQPNTATVLEGEVHGMYGLTPYMKAGGSRQLMFMVLVLAGLLYCYPAKTLSKLGKSHKKQAANQAVEPAKTAPQPEQSVAPNVANAPAPQPEKAAEPVAPTEALVAPVVAVKPSNPPSEPLANAAESKQRLHDVIENDKEMIASDNAQPETALPQPQTIAKAKPSNKRPNNTAKKRKKGGKKRR